MTIDKARELFRPLCDAMNVTAARIPLSGRFMVTVASRSLVEISYSQGQQNNVIHFFPNPPEQELVDMFGMVHGPANEETIAKLVSDLEWQECVAIESYCDSWGREDIDPEWDVMKAFIAVGEYFENGV